MKSKKGQFFLIAAVVIIVITVSVLTISNYTQTNQATSIEDLGEEMDIESNLVLDYCASQDKNTTEMDALMELFIDNYVEGLDNNKNIYFIFGDSQTIHFRGYQKLTEECACIALNNEDLVGECQDLIDAETCIEAQISNDTTKITQNLSISGDDISKVNLHLQTNSHEYTITPGQNFYFVIWENEEGETKVVVSE